MKYENTTYKLAAYIGTLEKISSRRAQYLADAEKVTAELNIYSDEYKKAHEEDARGKLNTAFLTDMVKYRESVEKLNGELIGAFTSDTKPKADVSNAVYLCMCYLSKRGLKSDKRYFEQLATPIYEAGDLLGLQEVVMLYTERARDTSKVPFGNVFKEVAEREDVRMKLDLLCEKTLAALPPLDTDIASRAQAEPFSKYGHVNGILEFTRKTKAEINGEPYTPIAAGVFAPMDYKKVR